ncbi:hypothetical protein [Roseomonas chloroacetimidivorans]|uniref:hypothetical protein n=1 Tax=Roseomonas chloroacetimidivorans TaxID=1766656 RepID=UPI003C75A5F7
MHHRDEIVSFGSFDREITRLTTMLESLGVPVDSSSDLKAQGYAAFSTLYYSVFSDERPAMDRWEEVQAGGALAGLGDLASKINRAVDSGGFEAIRPHLAKMVTGSVRMNASSRVTDEAANKNSELYVGCLALGSGMAVDLEDPKASAGGTNPDVLLTHGGTEWSIAVKASHSSKGPTIFGNVQKAVQQIERSERNGVVFINVKNILEHEAMARSGAFSSTSEATSAVGAAVDGVVREVRSSIVDQDWRDLFDGKRARPLIAFMGQVTVSAMVPMIGPMFVPVKVMRVLTVPPAPTDPTALTGLDAGAWQLLDALNEELQRNP